MEFRRDYSYGTHEVKGYEFDGGYICKDERFVGIYGNTVVDGWEVLSFTHPNKTVRVYYARTLKEAKEWVKNWKGEK